jgi:hypothetical protein
LIPRSAAQLAATMDDTSPLSLCHVPAIIATMVFLLGSSCFIWYDLRVSLLAFVGVSLLIYMRAASDATDLADDGVGCETSGLFCAAFDENNNDDTLSVLSGETWDSESDELDELEMIHHRHQSIRLANIQSSSNNNNSTWRRRPNVVVVTLAADAAATDHE